MTPEDDFPVMIKQRRVNLGLSQAACCAISGVEPSVWSRVERGESTQLTLKTSLMMLKGVRWNVGLMSDNPEKVDEKHPTLFNTENLS